MRHVDGVQVANSSLASHAPSWMVEREDISRMDTLILIKSMVISKIRPRRRYQCMVGRDHRFWAVKGVWVTCHGILLLPLYRSQAVSRSVRSMYRMRFCPGSKFEAECIRYCNAIFTPSACRAFVEGVCRIMGVFERHL